VLSEGPAPARTARRAIAAFMLIGTLMLAGEVSAGEPSLLPGTPSLASGLFRTPPGSRDKSARSNLFADRIGYVDIDEVAGLASRIVAAEGGPAANSASSAEGYGQFLRGTWLEVFARSYPRLAQQLSNEQILALREVKPLAVELTSRYAQDNALRLRRVGLPATDATLSLAHVTGAGGAIDVLVSHPEEPLDNVLSAEAISANPFMKQMTAGELQRWAFDRIRLPVEPAQPKRAKPRVDEEIEPLNSSEDFRIEGQTKASQALAENRRAIAGLEHLLQAASQIGAGSTTSLDPSTEGWLNSVGIDPARLLLADPTNVRIFNEAAARLVLDTIRSSAIRAAYREFKPIESNAGTRGELRPTVIRDVASALAEKMHEESATIIAIVRHRRGAGAGRPGTDGYSGHDGR
jgi:hypothetical protein